MSAQSRVGLGLGRVLLALVILSSVFQTVLLWDLDADLSALNLSARNWSFATMAAMFLFVTVVLAQAGRSVWRELTRVQTVCLVLMATYVLAWALAHSSPGIWLSALGWLLAIAMFPALLGLARSGGLAGDWIWNTLALAAVLHVLLFLAALWMLWGVPDYPWRGRPPGFNNIRHLTYFLVPAGAVAGMLYATRRQRAVCQLIAFVAALLYVFLTGARGGVLGIAAGLPMCLLLHRRLGAQIVGARVLELLAVTLLLLAVVAVIPNLPFDSIWARADALSEKRSVLSGRWLVWGAAAGVIRDNWLLGVGPVSVGNVPGVAEEVWVNHPHNLVLQVLLHWGIAGSALLIAAGCTLLANVRRFGRQVVASRSPAIAAMVSMVAHGAVDGSLYYPFSVAVFVIALVLLIRPQEDGLATSR